MHKIYFTLLIAFISTAINAQDFVCGADQIHNKLMETNIEYAMFYAEKAQKWSSYAKSKDDAEFRQSASTTIYEIPVVFHIMHTGEAIGSIKNPSDATIFALMDELNQKFHASWTGNPSAENGGVDVPIIFKLAKRTPTCEPSNGINRIDASQVPDYFNYGIAYGGSENGANAVDLQALSIWPNTQYLNIWIVTNIQGGYAGYAYFPGALANIDGIVLKSNQMSRAITHEVGHSLGLRHTFEGSVNSTMCPPNLDCTLDGDMICDTDPHVKMSTGACPLNTNICTGTSFSPIVHNIMNYTSCPNRFTAGQRDRMLFTLINYRLGLTTSYGDDEPGISIPVSSPVLACTPAPIELPNNIFNVGVRNVFLADLAYTSNGYSGDNYNYYIDHSLSQNCMTQTQPVANLFPGNTYTITITTGWDPENVRGWIDFNNDGVFKNSEKIISNNGILNNETHLAEFTVPLSAALDTSLRMRIASDFSSIPQPCSSRKYGQTEDFIVRITDNLSVKNSEKALFKIYPIPAKNLLNFSEQLDKVEIYTIDGKKAFSDNHKTLINIESLQAGTYILKGLINSTNQTFTKLIVKE